MTFLPIVERELRVTARRPGTYWMRFAIACAVIGAWFLLSVVGTKLAKQSLSLTIQPATPLPTGQ